MILNSVVAVISTNLAALDGQLCTHTVRDTNVARRI